MACLNIYFIDLNNCNQILIKQLDELKIEFDITAQSNLMNDIILNLQKWNKLIKLLNNETKLNLVELREDINNLCESAINNFLIVLYMDNFLMDGQVASSLSFVSTNLYLSKSHPQLLQKSLQILLDLNFVDCIDPMRHISVYNSSIQLVPLVPLSQICLINACIGLLNDETLMQTDFSKKDSFIILFIEMPLINLMHRIKKSNETLMITRTLLLLTTKIKQLLKDAPLDTPVIKEELLSQYLEFVDLHWEDPADVIRYQMQIIFSDLIYIFVEISESEDLKNSFLINTLKKYLNLSWFTSYKYNILTSLLSFVSWDIYLQLCPNLPQKVFNSLTDVSLVHHVSLFLKKIWVLDNNEDWCKRWLNPLLDEYFNNTYGYKQIINEQIIPHIFKLKPISLDYIYNKFNEKKNSKKRNYIGLLLQCIKHEKLNSFKSLQSNIDQQFIDLILDQAVIHLDQSIRLQALSILCTHKKTTPVVLQSYLRHIELFLWYNMHGHNNAGRQLIISHITNIFTCLNQSAKFIKKQNSKKRDNKLQFPNYYLDFLNRVSRLCFLNLSMTSSFSSRSLSLSILLALFNTFQIGFPASESEFVYLPDFFTNICLKQLVYCFLDTFEENKLKAFEIIARIPLNIIQMHNVFDIAELFDLSMQMACSARPQDCQVATYLLRLLIHITNDQQLLQLQNLTDQQMLEHIEKSDSRQVLLVNHLIGLLMSEIEDAKECLLYVAATRPLYPTMHCILSILETVSWKSKDISVKWNDIFNDLLQILPIAADLVSPVVNNANPEGNIPAELFGQFVVDVKNIKINLIDVGETMSEINISDYGEDISVLSKQEVIEKVCQMPEYLLVCGWRTIKEISLIFGFLSNNVPFLDKNSIVFFDERQIETIGKYFKSQLLSSIHKGAFELACAGFTQLTQVLWSSKYAQINELPMHWVRDLLIRIEGCQSGDELCVTRRSAGIPLFFRAVLATEKVCGERIGLKYVMSMLFTILSKPDDTSSTSKVHALNIMRVLFLETRLSEDILEYFSEGIIFAINGYISKDWQIRNSSTLLFSALILRVFGAKKSYNLQSRKISMTGKAFFNKYPLLFNFLKLRLEEAVTNFKSGKRFLNPELFLVLNILSNLTPSVAEGSNSLLCVDEFTQLLIRCSISPIMKVRQMAASALASITIPHCLPQLLNQLFQSVSTNNTSQNQIHGLLLQIVSILKRCEVLNLNLNEIKDICKKNISIFSFLISRKNHCFITRNEALLLLDYIVIYILKENSALTDKFLIELEQQLFEVTSQNTSDLHLPHITEYYKNCAYFYISNMLPVNMKKNNYYTLVEMLLSSSRHEIVVCILQLFIKLIGDNLNEVKDVNHQRLSLFVCHLILSQKIHQFCVSEALSYICSAIECGYDFLNADISVLLLELVLKKAKETTDSCLKLETIRTMGLLLTIIDANNVTILNETITFILNYSSDSVAINLCICNILCKNFTFFFQRISLNVDNVLIGDSNILKAWTSLFSYLTGDEEELRNEATKCALQIVKPFFENEMHPDFAIELLLEEFCNSHICIEGHILPHDVLYTLFIWIYEGLDGASEIKDEEMRLFDRRQFSQEKDELKFILLLHNKIIKEKNRFNFFKLEINSKQVGDNLDSKTNTKLILNSDEVNITQISLNDCISKNTDILSKIKLLKSDKDNLKDNLINLKRSCVEKYNKYLTFISDINSLSVFKQQNKYYSNYVMLIRLSCMLDILYLLTDEDSETCKPEILTFIFDSVTCIEGFTNY